MATIYSNSLGHFLGGAHIRIKKNPVPGIHFRGHHGGIVTYHPHLGGRPKPLRIAPHLKPVRVSTHMRAMRPGI